MKRTSNTKLYENPQKKGKTTGEDEGQKVEHGISQQAQTMTALNCSNLKDFQKDLIQYLIEEPYDNKNRLLILRKVNRFYCSQIDSGLIEYIKKMHILLIMIFVSPQTNLSILMILKAFQTLEINSH